MAWQSDRIAATRLGRCDRSAGPNRRQARPATGSAPPPPTGTTDAALPPDRPVAARVHGAPPRPDLAAIDRPVLAITGGKESSSTRRRGSHGRLVTGPFDGEVPDDLTHLLRRDPGPSGIWRYRAQLTRPVDRWLMDRIAAWTRLLRLPG